MNVIATELQPNFSPIKVEITLDSERELCALLMLAQEQEYIAHALEDIYNPFKVDYCRYIAKRLFNEIGEALQGWEKE